MVYKAVKKDTGGCLCSDVNKCTVNVSVPMIVRWVKTTCMCYNAVTVSTPSHLSELLHLYSPSCSLHSSSDTCMLKLNTSTAKRMAFTLRPPHLEQSPPVHHATLLSKANWKHLSFKNISAKQHCPSSPSVCAGCVCVDLAHGYTWTLVDVYIMLLAFVKLLITFSISVHIMCVKLCSVLWATG